MPVARRRGARRRCEHVPADRTDQGRPPKRPRRDHRGPDSAGRAAPLTVSRLFTCAPPPGHSAATGPPYAPRRTTTTPRSRRNTHMLRSFARRGGIVLAALALPVL